MRIIIVGAGAVGTHLAKLLSNEKQDITLIDDSAEKLGKLESNFDLLTFEGSPTSIRTLKDAGINGVDLFVAVTPEEGRNITACIIAHSLGAKKTLARVDNYEYVQPKNREFFKTLGIDSLIYPELLAAIEIADMAMEYDLQDETAMRLSVKSLLALGRRDDALVRYSVFQANYRRLSGEPYPVTFENR